VSLLRLPVLLLSVRGRLANGNTLTAEARGSIRDRHRPAPASTGMLVPLSKL
jgi:hypothetical protein